MFVIKDDNGLARLQLGVTQSGEVAISLTDEGENTRVQTFVDAQGLPSLILKDATGQANTTISVRPESNGIVVGDGRAGLLVLEDETVSLAIADRQGRPRAMLRFDDDDKPVMLLLDEDGNIVDGLAQP